MGKGLIDSNCIIEFVGNNLPPETNAYILSLVQTGELYASLVNWIEVMSYPSMAEQEQVDFEAFLTNVITLPISQEIAEYTATLRRQVKMKLPDAIVAATALYYDLTLLTRNVKDFQKVPNLRFVNPYDLST